MTPAFLFQSTPSGGKATEIDDLLLVRDVGFNPRLPGGRRPGVRAYRDGLRASVSIHAFRGEGDNVHRTCVRGGREFQSTPSGGKATIRCAGHYVFDVVSIHAFRGEGDRNI